MTQRARVKVRPCRSCGAPIVWAHTETGRAMPVDRDPVSDGNVALVPSEQDLRAVVAGPLEPVEGATDGVRRKSHFATCPHARQHRRPR